MRDIIQLECQQLLFVEMRVLELALASSSIY